MLLCCSSIWFSIKITFLIWLNHSLLTWYVGKCKKMEGRSRWLSVIWWCCIWCWFCLDSGQSSDNHEHWLKISKHLPTLPSFYNKSETETFKLYNPWWCDYFRSEAADSVCHAVSQITPDKLSVRPLKNNSRN